MSNKGNNQWGAWCLVAPDDDKKETVPTGRLTEVELGEKIYVIIIFEIMYDMTQVLSILCFKGCIIEKILILEHVRLL